MDTPAAKSERELLKRIEAINRAVEQQNGERAVVEALAYELRLSPQVDSFRSGNNSKPVMANTQPCAVLRYLGRGSLNRIADDYQRGRAWSEVASH